jgi:hypothetical protein
MKHSADSHDPIRVQGTFDLKQLRSFGAFLDVLARFEPAAGNHVSEP